MKINLEGHYFNPEQDYFKQEDLTSQKTTFQVTTVGFCEIYQNLWRFALGWAVLNDFQHLHKQLCKVGFVKSSSLNKSQNGEPNPQSEITNPQLPAMRPEHLRNNIWEIEC